MGFVAQLEERRSSEPDVEGSSPSRPVVLMNERSIFLNKQDVKGNCDERV